MACGRNVFVFIALSSLAVTHQVAATDPYHVVFHLQNLESGKSEDVVVKVHPDWAPVGAQRFAELLEQRFFDNNAFFRVVVGFVAQFGINGDPKVNAEWQDKTIIDDPQLSDVANERGTLSFFTDCKENDRSTQIIISTAKRGAYFDDNGYVPFAEVVEGMFHVDRIYSKYGGRDRAPDQSKLAAEGNTYAEKEFPDLTYIKSVEIMNAPPAYETQKGIAMAVGGVSVPSAGRSPWFIACGVFMVTAAVGSGWFFSASSQSSKMSAGEGEP